MLFISVIQGQNQGTRYPLGDRQSVLIGRNSPSLPVSDPGMSRRHAELTCVDGQWHITDLKSANGTFVNDKRAMFRTLLRPGDTIRCSDTVLGFIQADADSTSGPIQLVPHKQSGAAVLQTLPSNDDSVMMGDPKASDENATIRVFYDLTQILAASLGDRELLTKVMDLVFKFFPAADRGFILLQESVADRPEPIVFRQRNQSGPAFGKEPKVTVSRTLVDHVLQRSEGVLSANAMGDQRFANAASVLHCEIRSAMCVPIRYAEHNFGVIHIDSQIGDYAFDHDQLKLLTAIGVQTGMALACKRAQSQQIQKERASASRETLSTLSRMLELIVERIHGGSEMVDLGVRKHDIRLIARGWGDLAQSIDGLYVMTGNIISFVRTGPLCAKPTDVGEMLLRSLADVRDKFAARSIALITEIDPRHLKLVIDPVGIGRVIRNLLNNALDAVESKSGSVSLTSRVDLKERKLVITVHDNGPGVPENIRGDLFLPFHSSKRVKSIGLGLAVCKKVVEEHGGKIDIESSKAGTTVRFWLPLPASTDSIDVEAVGSMPTPQVTIVGGKSGVPGAT